MTARDSTSMGGSNEAFERTRWTDIFSARTSDPDKRRAAVAKVAQRYWRPVYAYLRRKGMDNEQAKDLTQEFFAEVVLDRGLIQRADRDKGRFRTLLLTALDRFVTSDYRKRVAAIRRPEGGVLPLDAMEADPPVPDRGMQPDEAFAFAWASQLLREALADVEAACRQAEQIEHWEVFRRAVAQPALEGTEAPSMATLCKELGIDGESRASNMNTTVKRRFRSVLHAKARELVASRDDVEAEIRDLFEILSRRGAGA